MAEQLTAQDGRLSLGAHAAAKGAELRARYGPRIGWTELQAILEDRSLVRYPCRIDFESASLQAGEFAYPEPLGERPEDGFALHVHPFFLTQLECVAALVLYQLVVVNYGEFASAEDAEGFGAEALGVTREAYYQQLCELSDQVAPGVPDNRDLTKEV